MTSHLPVLYSFRRCPYAMRARLGIAYSRTEVELREVVLKDKPASMLEASPKGTVPVMIEQDGNIIDESLDILYWAVRKNDPENWLGDEQQRQLTAELIHENDSVFKANLDRYKYFDRFPEQTQQDYREQCELTLQRLETRLNETTNLVGDKCMLADAAIFPFVRQFAFVDKNWFDQSPYPALKAWLENWINSDLFLSIMKKYPQWQPDQETVIFPE